ncbi:hypothetical protein HYV82_01360 [Candidatus Woesearchaeota archaeon]|nr:hypothetical protein [Candidatus Woesearchaeota archaeon]
MAADLLKEFLERKVSDAAPEKQTPGTCAIFCSDSRIDSSAFASEPINNLFPPRNIGNQVFGLMGSASYPIGHLHSVRLMAVVGHIGCGAVAAAYKMSRELNPQFSPRSIEAAVQRTYERLRGKRRQLVYTASEEAVRDELAPMAQFFANAANVIGMDEEPYLPKHAEANVNLQVAALLHLDRVREKVGKGELIVAGAVYDFLGKYGPAGSTYLVNVNGKPAVQHELAQIPEIRGCVKSFL